MNKKIIIGITVASAISIGALSGCKNAVVVEQKIENDSLVEEVTEVENTDNVAIENARPGIRPVIIDTQNNTKDIANNTTLILYSFTFFIFHTSIILSIFCYL